MEQFEWHRKKDELNQQKHNISFNEAKSVFNNPLSIYKKDIEHSIGEESSYIIGNSMRNKLLVVSFTERGNNIRIISARLATKKEKNYMKTKVKILDTPCDYIDEDIPEEIDFSNGESNPFYKSKKIIVEIEPDLANVFRNSNEVNNALRVLISAIPTKRKANRV